MITPDPKGPPPPLSPQTNGTPPILVTHPDSQKSTISPVDGSKSLSSNKKPKQRGRKFFRKISRSFPHMSGNKTMEESEKSTKRLSFSKKRSSSSSPQKAPFEVPEFIRGGTFNLALKQNKITTDDNGKIVNIETSLLQSLGALSTEDFVNHRLSKDLYGIFHESNFSTDSYCAKNLTNYFDLRAHNVLVEHSLKLAEKWKMITFAKSRITKVDTHLLTLLESLDLKTFFSHPFPIEFYEFFLGSEFSVENIQWIQKMPFYPQLNLEDPNSLKGHAILENGKILYVAPTLKAHLKTLDFASLLASPLAFSLFSKFCEPRKDVSMHNLNFLQKVQAFAKKPGNLEAVKLYFAYIPADSETAIEISAPIRTAIDTAIDNEQIGPTVYQEACNEVCAKLTVPFADFHKELGFTSETDSTS